MIRLLLGLVAKIFGLSVLAILVAHAIGYLLPNRVIAFTVTGSDYTDRVYLLDMNTGVRYGLNYATGIVDASSHSPQWSPDGSRLAFFSVYDRYFIDVHEVNFTEATVKNYTAEWGFRILPLYSEQANPTAFLRISGDVEQVFLQRAADTTPELLLEHIVGRPQLSPDGRYIAYLRPLQADDNGAIDSGLDERVFVDLYVQDLETGSVRNLTSTTDIYGSPVWSPDGTQIVMASWDFTLYLVDVAAGTVERISEDGLVLDFAPYWSPDGAYITFLSRRNGNYDLYLYETSSGRTTALTTHPSYDMEPTWSSDSQSVIFVSGRGGQEDLFHVNVRTGHITRLTDTPEKEGNPAWRPQI